MWAPVACWLFWRVTLAAWLPIGPQRKDAPQMIKKA